MPTYDYVCRSCSAELEVFQAITARPKRKCPTCGRNTLERKIGTGAGILFKGSGFYQTDYRSESYSKAQKAETSSAEPQPTADKPTGQGESKPDSKAAKPGKQPKPSSSDAA
jgi:putative FmdB family regulatory protein